MSFGNLASAENSTVYPGYPADDPACGITDTEICVEAYTANATQTLSRFVLITNTINNTAVTKAMQDVGSCFSASQQALVDIVQKVLSYGEFYQPNSSFCTKGLSFKDDNVGNFYMFSFAQDIDSNACWELNKIVTARGMGCFASARCPAEVNPYNIAAISLSTLAIVVCGVAAALVYMKQYNMRKKYYESSQPAVISEEITESRNELRQRLV